MKNIVIFTAILLVSQAMYLNDVVQFIKWQDDSVKKIAKQYTDSACQETSREAYKLSVAYTGDEIRRLNTMIEEVREIIIKSGYKK